MTEEKIRKFLKEIYEIYCKYGISISHQNTDGAFILEKYDVDNFDWLCNANRKFKSEQK